MIIQSSNNVVSAYLSSITSNVQRQAQAAEPATVADTVRADSVSISHAAWAALGASNNDATSSANSVDAKLAEIKSKDAVSRTDADREYLLANDKKLAEISKKNPDLITSSELDYIQKAGGFVNTMAELSPAEKALYDKAVASGNTQAAAGLAQIALIRNGGHMAGGENGTTYDPINTPITAANIEKYFSHSIIDPSGDAGAKFQALIQFLQNNPTTA